MAYFHQGIGIAESGDVMTAIIFGAFMLAGNSVPAAVVCEIKIAIAMKIMDLLHAGGSFTEFYAMDFRDDLDLMGNDGPGYLKIAQDNIKGDPLKLYHGKVGSGLSVEMPV